MKGLTLLLLVSLQACHCGMFAINTGSNLNLRGGAKKVVPFKVPPVSPRCKRASSIHLQNLQDKTKDPHVVYKAFNALSLICLDGEKQYRIGKNKNGCEALVETLKVAGIHGYHRFTLFVRSTSTLQRSCSRDFV